MTVAQAVIATAALFVGIMCGLTMMMLTGWNKRLDEHSSEDNARFNELKETTAALNGAIQNRHAENINEFRRLSRGQNRMTGALIVALSANATPDERLEMIRGLNREDT